MDVQRLLTVFQVECCRGGQESQRRISRFAGVFQGMGILKDRHKTIAGNFIDIAIRLMNTIEKGRKILFHQSVEGV
jgi:hypothetical protein